MLEYLKGKDDEFIIEIIVKVNLDKRFKFNSLLYNNDGRVGGIKFTTNT